MVRSLPSGVRRWGQRIEEKTMSESDYLAKEEALRRRSEPEGDHELHAALERMRESHPHLWEVIHRVHLSGDADRPS